MYVRESIGHSLFELANDARAHLNITLEPENRTSGNSNANDFRHSSIGALWFSFLSIIILSCSCVSWLIFYLCQRSRSHTTKSHLENNLTKAAKQALTKIPLTSLNETPRPEESCVICLDLIKQGDIVREISKRKKTYIYYFIH